MVRTELSHIRGHAGNFKNVTFWMRIFYAVENDSSTGVMLFLRKLSDDVIVNAADENGYL